MMSDNLWAIENTKQAITANNISWNEETFFFNYMGLWTQLNLFITFSEHLLYRTINVVVRCDFEISINWVLHIWNEFDMHSSTQSKDETKQKIIII